MTIDSSWIARLKEDAPHCFSKAKPFAPACVFLDGQIKLMCPNSCTTRTWDDYVRNQFERSIQHYLDAGVQCVVLAFDDYQRVPQAKSMTQTKRRKHVPTMQFHERDELPPVVPTGERWVQCIVNRVFKSKVITLSIFRISRHVRLMPGQALIIDYQGTPTRYTCDGPPALVEGLIPLGEADVKFPRYAQMFRSLQIDSVDGDSIPIALLHMERHGATSMSILRLETRTGPREQPAQPPDQAEEEPAAAAGGAPQKKERPRAPPRVYEYVHITTLFDTLRSVVIPQCVRPAHAAAAMRGHEMTMLAALIGLTGTDFTRGLPLTSGKSVYDLLPTLWMLLASAYDQSTRSLDPDKTLDAVVAHIYQARDTRFGLRFFFTRNKQKSQTKFHKHTREGSPLVTTLAQLAGSSLSERTKAMIHDVDTLRCTVKNINWLLRYWADGDFPDPIQPEFGYARTGPKGAVGYAT